MPRTKETFEVMRETTRQKIEAAALPLFARKGLSVTIGDIAQAAGLSKGLLYSHYPSKDALIAELLRQATSISAQVIKDIADGNGTAAEKIMKITSMMCDMLTSVDGKGIDFFMFTVQVGMSGFKTPEAAAYTAELPRPIESLARIILAGQSEGTASDGDPMQLALIYWAAVQGLCCYAITGMAVPFKQEILSRIILKEEFA